VRSKWLLLLSVMLGFFLASAPAAQAKLEQLQIKCTPAAFLLVDGQAVAPKPLKTVKIGVETGKHVVSGYNVGYMEEDWVVRIRPGQVNSIEIVLVKSGQNRDEMVRIAGGVLEMGVPAKRVGWMVKRLKAKPKDFFDQQPRHEVKVKPFYIDKYEVTNRQYAKFVKATKHRAPKHWKYGEPSKKKGDYPVVNVSWEDAAAYAKWAGKRLPSEVEWEMAARDGTRHIFPWGQVFRQNRTNIRGSGFNAASITGRYEKGQSHNDCYDFSGNVAEWTATWYAAYPGHKLSDPAAGSKTHRVVRGGSWKSRPHQATTVARDKLPPDTAVDYVGFRCVK